MIYRILLFVAFTFLSISSNAQLDTTGLIAHWPFDGNLNDSTGRGHNAATGYTVYSGTPTPVYVDGVNGKPGKAYQFRTNHITGASYQPDLNVIKYSIAAIIKFDTLGYAYFLSRPSHWGVNQEHKYGLGAAASPTLGNFFYPLTKIEYPNPPLLVNYSNGHTDSAWYFVVVTYDSLVYKTYVNGQLRKVIYSPYDRFTTTSYGLYIGGSFDTQFLSYSGLFSGAMDDLRLYNRVLSDSEIVRYPFGFYDTAVVISKMDTVLCAGDSTLTVTHLTSKPFRTNNIFTAQLSDATGSFASPTIIGTSNSNTSGNVSCIIPSIVSPGNYLVRIIATAPADTSFEYSLNIHPTQMINAGMWTTITGPYRQTPSTPMTICASDTINYIADSLAGTSAMPDYQWQKNGLNITGATNKIYSTGNITSNDSFRVIVTSNHQCWSGLKDTSRYVRFKVLPNPNPTVSIAPLYNDTVCLNKKETFFITSATDTGTSAYFNWYINSTRILATDTFKSVLQDKDTVYVKMTSNKECTVSYYNTMSNKIVVTVDTNILKPSVTITATPSNSVPMGTDITFTATTTDAGSNPYYQWYKNNIPIVGANNSTYIATWPTLQNNDLIAVMLKNTTDRCLNKDSTLSNLIRVFYSTNISSINTQEQLSVYPNPNNGSFNLSGTLPNRHVIDMTVLNMMGQVVYKKQIVPANKKINTLISLPTDLANGIYLLQLTNEGTHQAITLSLSR